MAAVDSPDPRQLQRRLDRERSARLEAEAIAEKALRDLYDKQQALLDEVDRRQALETQFRQSQKMEAIGRLAGGVAHDFNNLLTVILGAAEMLLESLPEGRARSFADDIRKAGNQAVGLTRQLLAFSRKQVLEPTILDLNDVVRELTKMLGRLIGSHIELTMDLAPNLRRVKADAGQIEQVVMNLVVNARDAMPDGGKILVQTANVDLDGQQTDGQGNHAGPYVMLAVTDTGCGMDEYAKQHLFEPFFTTKELGRGTGLGLATVYGIVKQSGGMIWVYSEPGLGATFKIYLPEAEGAPGDAKRRDESGVVAGGTETILLVEDAPELRALAALILQTKGYTVIEAGSGPEALAAAEKSAGPIHLVLCDVILPGMNGRLLQERLRAIFPDMRSLFMSGYTDDAVVHHGVLDAGVAFLQKPFTPASLARRVREVLDSDPPARTSPAPPGNDRPGD